MFIDVEGSTRRLQPADISQVRFLERFFSYLSCKSKMLWSEAQQSSCAHARLSRVLIHAVKVVFCKCLAVKGMVRQSWQQQPGIRDVSSWWKDKAKAWSCNQLAPTKTHLTTKEHVKLVTGAPWRQVCTGQYNSSSKLSSLLGSGEGALLSDMCHPSLKLPSYC